MTVTTGVYSDLFGPVLFLLLPYLKLEPNPIFSCPAKSYKASETLKITPKINYIYF